MGRGLDVMEGAIAEGQAQALGPQQGTGEVFSDNASATVISGRGWGVVVDLRSGAKGEDIWNALATQCYGGQTTCPTKQIAIELDGELMSVATVETPTFNGSVQISGSFTRRSRSCGW